jgi:hypothetical protein
MNNQCTDTALTVSLPISHSAKAWQEMAVVLAKQMYDYKLIIFHFPAVAISYTKNICNIIDI